MVRLRREIEGIHLDRAIAPPAWAGGGGSTVSVCPQFEAAVRELDAQRLLFCGLPDLGLAKAMLADGRWVTISDLSPTDVRALSAQVTPDEAGRLQLAAKSYGEATFAPSSFDAVVLSDQLHAYDAPEWLLQKVKRELKVDGQLLARLHVCGAIDDLPEGVECPTGEAPSPWQRRAVRQLTPWVERLAHSPIAPLWLAERGLDAVDRGAMWTDGAQGAPLGPQLAAISSRLHLEGVFIGATLRATALTWAAGARPGPGRLVARLAHDLPELADEADRALPAQRAVWVRARRALLAGGTPLTFGR